MIFQFLFFLQNSFYPIENENIPKAKSSILDKQFGKAKNACFFK